MVRYDNTHYEQISTLENYDLCRHIPQDVLSAFAKVLIDLTSKSSRGIEGKILEEGVGNGRILIPVMKESMRRGREDKFYAIDKSSLMIEDLRKRLIFRGLEGCDICLGDVQEDLPYSEHFFDCIYTFAVYHILNKPKRALDLAIKKLKQRGFFALGKEFNQVFHGTENKIEKEDSPDFEGINLEPRIKAFFHKYHQLRGQYNVPFVPSGVLYSDPTVLIDHLASKGFEHTAIKGDELTWEKPHTFRQMLNAFRSRNITTFGSDISDSIRTAMHTDLTKWCKYNSINLDEVINIPAKITIYVFSKK